MSKYRGLVGENTVAYHMIVSFFVSNATATTVIYTLSLHAALPFGILIPIFGNESLFQAGVAIC